MKLGFKLVCGVVLGLLFINPGAQAADSGGRWRLRIDVGGVIPQETDLREFDGPTGDNKFKLNAGFQYDMALDYQVTPWLGVGPELGFTFNGVDSIGAWSTGDTTLFQMLMMANVVLQYPTEGPLIPFAGAGIGGSAGFLTFWGDYDDDDYPYVDPDGAAADIVLAFQAFGGLRVRVSENLELGVVYRLLATQPRHWDVNWDNGPDFDIGTDRLIMHSVCLVFSGTF
jgi:opacity protein-like surface antigen